MVLPRTDLNRCSSWPISWPIAMIDAVQAAVAEIDDDLVHVRVEPGYIAKRTVVDTAAADVVHLLAELIKNAAAVSSPVAKVQVNGHSVLDRYVLEVQDRGIGRSSDRQPVANDSLADVVPLRLLRLFDRLAATHGIMVRLCRSSHGGINAVATLPQSVLEPETVDIRPRNREPEGAPRPLPRRIPRKSLRELSSSVAAQRLLPPSSVPVPARRLPPAPPVRRSPDEVRSTLASFHSGLKRARTEVSAGHLLRTRLLPAATKTS